MHFLRRHDFTILLSTYFFLLPVGKTLWYPLFIMALIGAVLFFNEYRSGKLSPGTHWLLGLGACIWLPALLSTPDSIDLGRSMMFVGTYPLFFLVGYFLYRRLKEGASTTPFLLILIPIVLFWGALAIWQYIDPNNPFGRGGYGGYQNQGIFTRDNPFVDGGLMMGVILGSLFAFVTLSLWDRGYFLVALLMGVFIASLCWISGTRSSWVSIIITLACLPILAAYRGFRPTAKTIGIIGIIGVLLSGSGYWLTQQPNLSTRLNQTLIILESPSLDNLNKALSGRIELWSDAIAIGKANPWVGVGVNNYRFATALLEEPAGKRWITDVTDADSPHKLQGASHTHQIAMETFSGAGWIGVTGLILFYLLLCRLSIDIFKKGTLIAAACVLAFWAYFWPINTHNNFHGGWVSGWFWVWLGLTVGSYYSSPRPSSKTNTD